VSHFLVLAVGVPLAQLLEPFREIQGGADPYDHECYCRRWPENDAGVDWTNGPDPDCEDCRGSGVEVWDDNPIGRWDSWTVTHGHFMYRPGSGPAVPNDRYEGLCYPRSWIGEGPYRYPQKLSAFDSGWDYAVLADIDVEAMNDRYGVPWSYAFLSGDKWTQPHDGVAWFPSITRWADQISFVDQSLWAASWTSLLAATDRNEIVSLINCHA